MSKRKGAYVEVEFAGGDGGDLSITMKGPVTTVVGCLVNGMPQRALEHLLGELTTITKKRAKKKGRRNAV